MTTRRSGVAVATVTAAALAATACSGSARESAADAQPAAADPALVALPPVVPVTTVRPSAAPAMPLVATTPKAAAAIDVDGQLVVFADGVATDTWLKWTALPSPDRSTAVLTLGPHIDGIGPMRPLTWLSVPSGDVVAEQTMSSASELTALSLDGEFAALTTRSSPVDDGAIAGARDTSVVEIISRDGGSVFRQEIDGNFVPEAFGRRVTAAGVPSQVFLLEYFPADSPRFYRVRVLSTETGEVSLPLNLRDKQQQVDERMAGFSRSQVVADEHGLLFTLYRGTIDGTPDGEPYAFIHTLDFADGVWCLEVDPRLDLADVPGSLAVGGDRLYVASANGWVGSYPIPSISDPDLSPSMDWTVSVTRPADVAPVMLADDRGVWVGPDDPASRLVRIDADGVRGDPIGLPSSRTSVLAFDSSGAIHAVGEGWATLDLDRRPGWLGEIAHLIVG